MQIDQIDHQATKMRLHCLFPVFPVSPGLWEEQIRRTEVQNLSNLQNLPNLQSHNTWIIHHFARLSLEIRNNNNYRRLPKFSLFPVFFAVSVSTFWALNFFCRFIGILRRFVGFFRRFKTGKHMQHEKNAKSVRRQNKNAASNNSWKGNNFAYIGRRRYIL